MRFDPEEFKQKSIENFDTAWHEGKRVIDPPFLNDTYPRTRYKRAKVHPVYDTIQRLRETYLGLGFDEASVPLMIEEQEVYRQFGPEAMAVLDRVFYLGGLPRPNVGIGKDDLEKISSIIGKPVTEEIGAKLQETLHKYKKGLIDGDDLVNAISNVLQVDDGVVVIILEKVFPEFRELTPDSSRITLRSHMTSGWFLSLADIWDRSHLPLRLFSVDRCFRREQAEGPTRLMSYHSASCIVAGEEITNEEGKAISEGLLSSFGFTSFKFSPDEKRSKYYVPGTQTEVYALHPTIGWVEVATFGMYSPTALSQYGIGIPVMNLGLGVERLAMILSGSKDVRALTYPQFFPARFSDIELAKGIQLTDSPKSLEGRHIASAIVLTALSNSDSPGPCEFQAWSGELFNHNIIVSVLEKENNTKLLGPACENAIFFHEGALLGIPDNDKWAHVKKEGIYTGFRFIDAIAQGIAAKIELSARCGEGCIIQVKMAKSPADINITLSPYVRRYITDNHKKTDLRGPIFLTVKSVVDSGE